MTGYLRHDVFLPCKFIPGPTNDNVTQVQWGFQESEQNETVILVSHHQLGMKVHDTFLKHKVAIKEQSLIVRDLAERDAGLYACRISAFPSGTFSASVRLMVQGKPHLQDLSAVTKDHGRTEQITKPWCRVSSTRADSVIIGRAGCCCDCCLLAVCDHCDCVLHVDQKVCVTHMNISNKSSQQLFEYRSPYKLPHYI